MTDARGRMRDMSALMTGAAMLVAIAAGVAEAQGVRGGGLRKMQIRDSLMRDSVVQIQVTIGPNELAKMIAELVASRETEERIARSLHELAAGDASRREIEQRLMTVVRRNAGLISAIRFQCAQGDEMQPEGYMGLNFVGVQVRKENDQPAMYYFGNDTRVVSVDPGSPAEKAGISAADEVVAIAGNDARRPVALGTLLKPGARITVRLSRDGRTRETTVTVAKRQSDDGAPCAQVDEIVGPQHAPQQMFIRQRSPEPPRQGAQGTTTTTLTPGEGGMVARTGPGGFAFMSPYPTMGPGMLGGASFITLDAEWRETLGVDKGLLVSMVAPGSPAQAAGLKKGDVIVGAGENSIATMAAFWREVSAAGADGVTLKLVRGGKPATAVFKLRTRE
jgi:S1-C subfamily serine protease